MSSSSTGSATPQHLTVRRIQIAIAQLDRQQRDLRTMVNELEESMRADMAAQPKPLPAAPAAPDALR